MLDGDDPYLVVAADKGTATFSDTANAVSEEFGFWLGDAFASGGSAGYDHKALGITARGAWESVKRHFRELGVDVLRDSFTSVGIGDMSGDVFGNGMLLQRDGRAARGLRPSQRLRRSRAGRGRLVRGAAAAVPARRGPLERLRPHAAVARWRCVRPAGEVGGAVQGGARGAWDPRRGRRGDDPRRADPMDPAVAGGSAVERRDRHVREVLE